MIKILESIIIYISKKLKISLLGHAHVQIGVGHNTYNSGEEYVIEIILKKIFKGQKESELVFFDVGAHHGESVMLFRNHFASAIIYSFEPDKLNIESFKKNTVSKNVNLIPFGLSNQEGIVTFYRDKGTEAEGSMTTMYKDTITDIFKFENISLEEVKCEVIVLDAFFSSLNSPKINFLKIDVEGNELNVLKGAVNLINGNKIDVIQFEFNEFNITSKSFMKDFYTILFNYDFYRIKPDNSLFFMGEYESSLEIFRYQNILAINKNLNFVYA